MDDGKVAEISQQVFVKILSKTVVVLYQLEWKKLFSYYLSYDANMFQGKLPPISVFVFP